MSGLANRLVTAAVKAQQDGLGVEEKARLSVSAVLRDLDVAVMRRVLAGADEPIDLTELADAVERGEQA